MKIKKFDIWIANLNPVHGTEPGKNRPVIIFQTDLLNKNEHPSTIVLPITTNIKENMKLLRVSLDEKDTNLNKPSAILIDQIRSIDNSRLKKNIGSVSKQNQLEINKAIKIMFDFM